MAQTTLTRKQPAEQAPYPPGPRGHWLWGMLPAIQRDMLGLYRESAREYGDVVRLRFVNVDTFALSHPDHFRHVLQDNNRNYVRNPFFNDIVRLFIGESLFTTDGESWLSRRRLMQPAFHRQRIAAFGELMTAATHAMLEQWDRGPAGLGPRLAIDQEMMALTLRIAGQALFSVDLLGQASTLGKGFAGMSEYVNYRLGHPYQAPAFIPTRANRLLKGSKRILDQQVYDLIRARRKAGGEHNDLLGLLMAARDADSGEGMSDRQLHDEIMVMMFAGHETTAVTLGWVFYLLSEHPEAEARLAAELAQVLGGRAPTVADLPNLPYTRRVIDEALRLYPPAFGITRQSVEADEIGGYRIPARSSVTLLTWNAHRDPRFWEEPERFDPDRFSPERSEQRPALAYLPFGAGPRQCIGNQFALTEAQLVLATIAQRYQLRLVPGHPVRPKPVFVLHTSDGLPMTATRR